MTGEMGLFTGELGLFPGEIGLFTGEMGLFCVFLCPSCNIGALWELALAAALRCDGIVRLSV